MQGLYVDAESLQLCPALCSPVDCARQALCAWGFLARILELPFSPPSVLSDPGIQPASWVFALAGEAWVWKGPENSKNAVERLDKPKIMRGYATFMDKKTPYSRCSFSKVILRFNAIPTEIPGFSFFK